MKILGAAALCFSLSCIAYASSPEDVITGYRLENRTFTGAAASEVTVDPVWVADYHHLKLRYVATGLDQGSHATLLLLRPGSVGPVTPHATNPENPFANGSNVAVLTASDLIADGKEHEVSIELKGKTRTPQIDQFIFSLPKGSQLEVKSLAFVGDPELLDCNALKHAGALPAGAVTLNVRGPLACDGIPATGLREEGKIEIAGKGHSGKSLYLELMAHYAGFSNYDASAPSRPKESGETSSVIARIHYVGSKVVEEQFPMLLSERRHVLLNHQAALYGLALDPSKKLQSVELVDKSVQAQLVVYQAAISEKPMEPAIDELIAETLRPAAGSGTPLDLSASEWFRVEDEGKKVSDKDLHPNLTVSSNKKGKQLSLELTNTSNHDLSLTLQFPSLEIKSSTDAKGLYYLLPQGATTISNADVDFSARYGSKFLLQFVDVFSPGSRSGVGVIVEDASAKDKTFHVTKQGSNLSLRTVYSIHLKAGETFHAPNVSLVLHGGDWHEGFDAYRQWVESWNTAKPRPSTHWLQSSFYARRDYPVGGSGLLFDEAENRYTFDKLIQDGAAFGGIDFIDISGWALSDKLGRVGDYPIELGGVADLKKNIAAANQHGLYTGLYFEGYLVDKNSEVGKQHGAAWQIVDKDGKGVWWKGGSPELFECPHVPDWRSYLSNRISTVASQVDAKAVYLDEFGCGQRQCFSSEHGHAVGDGMIGGEIMMAKDVRRALNEAGRESTILYAECLPVDVAAPYFDGLFSYSLPASPSAAYGVKLNLWRFTFPHTRIWDMLSAGVEPHILSLEDFRLSLWHGDGVWLKGRSDSWYGKDVLAFLKWAHPLLKQHAEAFAGKADPLIASSDPNILINRFEGGGETVYTLFNSSYHTEHFKFLGKTRSLAPRDVDIVSASEVTKAR